MLPRSSRIMIALVAGPALGALVGLLIMPVIALLGGWTPTWRDIEEGFAWGLITFAPIGAILGLFPGAPLLYWIVWARKAQTQ